MDRRFVLGRKRQAVVASKDQIQQRILYPFLGAEKSFDDVFAVIDAVERAANEGQLKIYRSCNFSLLSTRPCIRHHPSLDHGNKGRPIRSKRTIICIMMTATWKP